MEKHQLEINFAAPALLRPALRRQRRITRARWWFERMRQTVDQAWDWSSGPPARAGQTRLDLATTHGKL
jgi:hypothetical protein